MAQKHRNTRSGVPQIAESDARAEARFTGRWAFSTGRGKALLAAVHCRIADGAIELPRQVQARAKFGKALSALLAELTRRLLSGDEDTPIFVPRSKRVLESLTRYDPPGMNAYLPLALDGLAALDIIEQTIGHVAPDGRRRQTVVTPRPAFAALIREREITHDDVGEDRDVEVILLKGPPDERGRKRLLPYTDDPNTNRLRRELRTIIDAISAASISIVAPCKHDPSRRLLKRHFTEAFGYGGRLYGGFWQDMKGEQRRELLLIDDEAAVELDLSSAGLRILYGMAGAQPPAGDLYDLPSAPAAKRDDVKALIAALMFVEVPGFLKLAPLARRIRPDLAARAGQDADDFERHMIEKLVVERVVSAIKERHAPVADYLPSLIGHRVQRVESDILVRAMLDLIGKGIVPLPVHDGLIVRLDHAEVARAVLAESFEAVAGAPALVHVKV